MARCVEESDVRAVIELGTDDPTDDDYISLGPFIAAAKVLTDKVEACASATGNALGDTELRWIQTYIAAHFASLKYPQIVSERTERAQASYARGGGGDGKDWMSIAKMFDDSGCLDELTSDAGKDVVGMTWLGRAPSDQTDYVDRD